MQYKIPVQIENEDPIFLGLSLRQLAIIMAAFSVAYVIFTSLEPNTGWEIALIPSGIIALIGVAIAIFKYNEMTFVPFVLSLIRINIFPRQRKWDNGVDSFQAIDVGFLSNIEEKTQENIDMSRKIDTIDELNEKLKKI